VSRQLLSAGERRWEQLRQMYSSSVELGDDGTFSFIGEVISRICRRGQAGIYPVISSFLQISIGAFSDDHQDLLTA